MAIVKLGSGKDIASASSNGFTSTTFNTSSANFIVVNIASSAISDETVTDSNSNTWIKLTIRGTGKSTRLYYTYYKGSIGTPIVVGTGHTFTISGTATFPSMQLAWYSGVLTSSDPFNKESGAEQPFNATIQPGSLTPDQADSLLVLGLQYNQTTTAGSISGGGFTALEQEDLSTSFGHQGGALAYVIQSGAGSASNPTYTYGPGSATLDAAMAVFKPGATAETITIDKWFQQHPDARRQSKTAASGTIGVKI